jgi:hypothetical protein
LDILKYTFLNCKRYQFIYDRRQIKKLLYNVIYLVSFKTNFLIYVIEKITKIGHDTLYNSILEGYCKFYKQNLILIRKN